MMDYFYSTQANQFDFIKIPKELVTGEMFSSLSNPSKLLYGMMLDRISLSLKNHWLDDKNRVYIVYTLKDIMEDMNFSRHKAIDCLNELECIGLILKKQPEKGKESQIYVKNYNEYTKLEIVK